MTRHAIKLLRRVRALWRLRADLADLAPAGLHGRLQRRPDVSNIDAWECDLAEALLPTNAEVGDGQEDHA